TLTAPFPCCPPRAPVIGAWPRATPVPSPVALTVATAGVLLAQVTTRPVSTLPFASLVVAVSCTVPATTTVGAGGVTVTDATVVDGPSLLQVTSSTAAAVASRRPRI